MEIIHVSAECYPVAKVGGLGDVVGALPKYQAKSGHEVSVVMPMYRTKFLYDNEWDLVYEGKQNIGSHLFHYSIIKEKINKLGFDLYLIDINNLLDREKVYGYDDDSERFISFQIAVCDWLTNSKQTPDIIHCHDHHTGFIPFMIKYCFAFNHQLANVPTIFTIHNAQYQGWLGWDKYFYVPPYDSWRYGLLEWKNMINPMAAAVKCAWKVTTVSPSYLEEIKFSANGLENLFEFEKGKCSGILNGIDTQVWNPEIDTALIGNYDEDSVDKGKRINKQYLCNQFNLDLEKPLIVFIGRLVGEKAADLLPAAISQSILQYNGNVNFLVLGSGDPVIEAQLEQMKGRYIGYCNAYIGYQEKLSHIMYAGADFLLMPSRVEPCWLNQLYALRYGTVPMVRNTGGLRDTVRDLTESNGFGLQFNEATVGDITNAVGRAIDLYENYPEQFARIRSLMMGLDHSWDTSANHYIDLYDPLVKNIVS